MSVRDERDQRRGSRAPEPTPRRRTSTRSTERRSDDGRDRASSRQESRSARPRPAHARRGLTYPVVAAIVGAAILLTALVTVLVMRPRVESARSEAAAAQSQVSTLTSEVEGLRQELAANDPTSSSRSQVPSGAVSGVEDPWVDTGRFTTGDAVLDEEVKHFVDSTTGGKTDRAAAAFEMYKALAWAEYVERDNAQNPSGASWRNTYAHQYFENGNSGNCYEFAAALMYCMRYLGYEDAIAEGILIELQSGNWGDHGIVFVTDTEGNERMCDTARGTDGWMLSTGAYNYTVQSFEGTPTSSSSV